MELSPRGSDCPKQHCFYSGPWPGGFPGADSCLGLRKGPPRSAEQLLWSLFLLPIWGLTLSPPNLTAGSLHPPSTTSHQSVSTWAGTPAWNIFYQNWKKWYLMCLGLLDAKCSKWIIPWITSSEQFQTTSWLLARTVIWLPSQAATDTHLEERKDVQAQSSSGDKELDLAWLNPTQCALKCWCPIHSVIPDWRGRMLGI